MFSREFRRVVYRAALAKEDIHFQFKRQPSYAGHFIFSGLRMDDGAELTMLCGHVMRMTEVELKTVAVRPPVDCVKCLLVESGSVFG